MIGTVVGGRYRVERKLAAGGMGIVYEAAHTGTGRRVALKVISPTALETEPTGGWLERFEREARAAGAVDSPHIAQVLDAGSDEETGSPFMAIEFLAGEDVRQMLKRIKVMQPDAALRLVGQAAKGLAKAHQSGVIHRDIKPGNLFLVADDDGKITVKILDFGIAKISVDVEGELTRTGSVLGTPSYMSPEQAQGLKSVDHRADLWSLGVVLFKLLCGRTPFAGAEGPGQLIVAISTQDAPPVDVLAPWVPHQAASIVRRALTRDKSQRYQSADEMIADIRAVLPGGDLAMTSAMVAEGVPTEMRSSPAAASRPFASDSGFGSASGGSASLASGGQGSDDSAGLEVISRPGEINSGTLHATSSGSTTAQPRGRLLMGVAVVGLVAVIGLGVTLTMLRASSNAPAPAAALPSAPPATSNAAQDDSVDVLNVEVTITPADATVMVDGEARSVADGKLSLKGRLGSSMLIRIQKGDASKEARVAITETGAVPATVALASPEPATAKLPIRTQPPARPLAKRKPVPIGKKPSAPKPKPKTGGGVQVDTDFGD